MEILQLGLAEELVRDEIWIQLMKQGTGNNRESVGKVWQLIYLCSKTFPPSEELYLYVQVFVWTRSQRVTDSEGPKVHELAKTTLEELERTHNDGPAESCPSSEEIDALRSGQRMYASVEFLVSHLDRTPLRPRRPPALFEGPARRLALFV